MEFADQLDRIGYLSRTMASEQVADGDIGRTPERFACKTCQMLVQEEGCAFIRKDHRDVRQVSAVFSEQISCDIFEKTIHSSNSF